MARIQVSIGVFTILLYSSCLYCYVFLFYYSLPKPPQKSVSDSNWSTASGQAARSGQSVHVVSPSSPQLSLSTPTTSTAPKDKVTTNRGQMAITRPRQKTPPSLTHSPSSSISTLTTLLEQTSHQAKSKKKPAEGESGPWNLQPTSSCPSQPVNWNDPSFSSAFSSGSDAHSKSATVTSVAAASSSDYHHISSSLQTGPDMFSDINNPFIPTDNVASYFSPEHSRGSSFASSSSYLPASTSYPVSGSGVKNEERRPSPMGGEDIFSGDLASTDKTSTFFASSSTSSAFFPPSSCFQPISQSQQGVKTSSEAEFDPTSSDYLLAPAQASSSITDCFPVDTSWGSMIHVTASVADVKNSNITTSGAQSKAVTSSADSNSSSSRINFPVSFENKEGDFADFDCPLPDSLDPLVPSTSVPPEGLERGYGGSIVTLRSPTNQQS